MKKGTLLKYTNHAGEHIVEYVSEIKDGAYTSLVGKWNGFKEPIITECFKYMGVIQSGWRII